MSELAICDLHAARGHDHSHPRDWVAVFAGARDSYQAAIALHEAGLLRQCVTDLYAPLDSSFFRMASRLLPSGARAKWERRFSPSLPSSLVKSNWQYAAQMQLRAESWPDYSYLLGERAAQVAKRYGSGILAYSHVATPAFQSAPHARKVLIQVQPHPSAVRDALLADRLVPEWDDRTYNELQWPKHVFDRYMCESHLADLCITASDYTRRTLLASGVPPERTAVVPYGVDLEFFTPGEERPHDFTVLFAGQLTRQKGLHYLLSAWKKLSLRNAELRVAGAGNVEALARYFGGNVRQLGQLLWNPMRDEYRYADLVCLPSLSDNFPLVALQALACGTPVLTTTCCGAADVIEEGQNGWTVPAANVDALSAALVWAYAHRDCLVAMRGAARRTAEGFSWSVFRQSLIALLSRSQYRPR